MTSILCDIVCHPNLRRFLRNGGGLRADGAAAICSIELNLMFHKKLTTISYESCYILNLRMPSSDSKIKFFFQFRNQKYVSY